MKGRVGRLGKQSLTHNYNLQVKPCVKKWVEREPGFNYEKFYRSNPLFFAMPFMVHAKIAREEFSRNKFVIPLKVSSEVYLALEYSKVDIKLSELIFEIFKQSMICWTRGQMATGVGTYQAIQNFLDHYEISEDDYPTESARKVWQRVNVE